MADYSTASNSANSALNTSTDGGFVEEYEVAENRRRVKRGSLQGQIDAAAKLEGLAARRSGGLFRLAKLRRPRA